GAFRSMSLANCFVVLERERGRVEVGARWHRNDQTNFGAS
ncbi:hypothetical protein, partial [Vibrio cholerae]